MLCQLIDPTKIIKTLASFVLKDGSISNSLAFVPTRRAARALEMEIAQMSGGAALMPKIVPLGSGENSDEEDAIGTLERAAILSKLLLAAGLGDGFSSMFAVAKELVALADHLENEGVDIKSIDWRGIMADEKKATFLDAIKNIDWGRPTTVQVRNAGIAAWDLSNYGAVYCAGSTASVRDTRELMKKIAKMPNGVVIIPGFVENLNDIGRTDPYWSIKSFLRDLGSMPEIISQSDSLDACTAPILSMNKCFSNDLSGEKLEAIENIVYAECDTEAEEADVAAAIVALAERDGESVMVITPDSAGEERLRTAMEAYDLNVDSSAGAPLSRTRTGRFVLRLLDYAQGLDNKKVIAADLALLCDTARLDDIKFGGDYAFFFKDAMKTLDFNADAAELDLFFQTLAQASRISTKCGLDTEGARTVLADALKQVAFRGSMKQ
ncbi:MAG: hypothetical protein LBB08_02710, partial [Rickettsiales bacterium]|nr:hypothetical protein [Rickettsiales bacterium]